MKAHHVLSSLAALLHPMEDARRAACLVAIGSKACIGGVGTVYGMRSTRECLSSTCRTILMCCVVAVSIWLPCLVLRLPPFGIMIHIEDILINTSFVVLKAYQVLLPELSGSFFFCCLAEASDAHGNTDLKTFKQKPVLRGFMSQLRFLLVELFIGAGLLALIVASANLWIPLLAGVVGGVLLLSPFLLGGIGVVLVLLMMAAKSFKPVLDLHSTLGSQGPIAAFAFVLLWACGQHNAVVEIALIYSLSIYLSKQLLTQYSTRLTSVEWNVWCSHRQWVLVGFGLPVAVTIRFGHPLLALVLLEMLQGSAAVLVVTEEARGSAGGSAGYPQDEYSLHAHVP
jgi:hypothetical protein